MPNSIWEQLNKFLTIGNDLLAFIIVSVITLLFCIALSIIKTRLKKYANSQKRQNFESFSQKAKKYIEDEHNEHFPEE